MQKSTPFIVYIQFFAVLEKIIETSGIAGSKRVKVGALFSSEIISMGLRNSECKVVEKFYRRPLGTLDLEFQPKDEVLSKSIQSLYERLCTIVGPVDADELFGRTLEKVSKSQAAQVYPPQRFL